MNQTHNPHPITGAPGTYQFVGGIGYIRIDAPEAEVGQSATQETGALGIQSSDPRSAAFANSNLGGPSQDERRVYTTGANAYHYGGDLMEQNQGLMQSGTFGNFTQDSWDRHRAAGGTGNPMIDTNPADIAAILEMYQSDSFNPYAQGDIREGSVADVMYGITKDNVGIRGDVRNALRGQENLGSQRMTNRLWNSMGLDSSVGNYNDYVSNPLSGGNPLMSGDRSTGSFNSSYNNSRGNTPPASLPSGSTGSFLDAYNAKRAETRPSVRSLFKEMEGYENE
jgi:hypothetical protein